METTRNDNGELNSPVPDGFVRPRPKECEVCHLAMSTEHWITRVTKPPGQIPCVEVRTVCGRCYRMTPIQQTPQEITSDEEPVANMLSPLAIGKIFGSDRTFMILN